MKIDFICYERKHDEEWCAGREWVCHIWEAEGLQRSWHAERHVGNLTDKDGQAKTEAIDEAFTAFHEILARELGDN